VWGVLNGPSQRFFPKEEANRIKHKQRGLVGFANNGGDCHGSQFYITLAGVADFSKRRIFPGPHVRQPVRCTAVSTLLLPAAAGENGTVRSLTTLGRDRSGVGLQPPHLQAENIQSLDGKGSIFGEVVEEGDNMDVLAKINSAVCDEENRSALTYFVADLDYLLELSPADLVRLLTLLTLYDFCDVSATFLRRLLATAFGWVPSLMTALFVFI
jgi:cyclophilin family peptidyl-prolyl cis-trans isomerase